MTIEQTNMSKGRKITAWILIVLLGALFLMGGIMKLTGGQEVSDNFTKYGLGGREMLIGLGELVAAILFLIPRTSSLGVLLVTAHLGGAIATHMEHGESFIPAAIMLLLVWLANWLRNPEMLASFTKK